MSTDYKRQFYDIVLLGQGEKLKYLVEYIRGKVGGLEMCQSG